MQKEGSKVKKELTKAHQAISTMELEYTQSKYKSHTALKTAEPLWNYSYSHHVALHPSLHGRRSYTS
jgi:hypothetical protein